jgi:hypothetical protein
MVMVLDMLCECCCAQQRWWRSLIPLLRLRIRRIDATSILLLSSLPLISSTSTFRISTADNCSRVDWKILCRERLSVRLFRSLNFPFPSSIQL